jgi:hypothetical protein
MQHQLELVELHASPPALFLPVNEGEVRSFLRLPELSPPDNLSAEIEMLTVAAVQVAERFQGRDLIPRRYRLYVCPGAGTVRLRRPVEAVHSVSEISADLVETPMQPADWRYDPAHDTLEFLHSTNRAVIDFSTRAADLALAVRIGILQLISMWWNARVPILSAPGEIHVRELPHSLTALLRFGGDHYAAAI